MLDKTYNVQRYIAEYSDTTDELLAEYELETFNLKSFQAEFDESPKMHFRVDAAYKESIRNLGRA